jgi:hypothetical protein
MSTVPTTAAERKGIGEDDVTADRLTAGQFAMSFALRSANLAWLLGAGASADSFIATGYDMIVDFKAKMYCDAMGISRAEIDVGDPLWLARITNYFDGANGFPPSGSPGEYAVAFECVYPSEADRRRYIESQISRGRPSFAHRVLAGLIGTRQLPVIFETNFDSLVETASAVLYDAQDPSDRPNLTVASLDSADRAERCLRENAWPLLVKLHGDYQSTALKNTPAELQKQDERLRRVLVTALSRFGLVVVGYSGRDASVMEVLLEACNADLAYPNGLFWVVRPHVQLLPAVEELLDHAATKGVETHLVVAENFVELASSIERQIAFPEPVSRSIRASRPTPRVVPVPIPKDAAGTFPVLRTSALPILALPLEARRIRIRETKTTTELQQLLRDREKRGVAVACQGSEVTAFGSDADLLIGLEPLDPKIVGTVELHPESESWALGLAYEALVRGITWERPLRSRLDSRRGHALLLRSPDPVSLSPTALRDRAIIKEMNAAYGESRVDGRVPTIERPYAEAVRLSLEHHLNSWWCVFEPFTWVDLPRRTDDPDAEVERRRMTLIASDWRRERWAKRYNSRWDKLFAAWTNLLVPDRPTTIRFPSDRVTAGATAEFSILNYTAWSAPRRIESAR